MNYYIINNQAIKNESELNSANGYPNAVKITATAYGNLAKGTHVIVNNKVVVKPVYVPTLAELKANKIAELEAGYKAWEEAGWADPVSGLILFISDGDKVQYTQLKSLIESDVIKPIGTTTGWHDMAKAPLLSMLVAYGDYCFEAYKRLSDLKVYVNYLAQTEEEVQAVSW